MPKISVIMPAYNAEKYIKESVDSILGQSVGDFELIIINDSSKDATEDIVLSYEDDRIVYVKNERNMGVAATLNRGLDLAKGEYIARMDADDISKPNRFEKQLAYMEKHPECGICGSNLLLFGQGKMDEPFCFAESDKEIRADMLFNSSFAHPSVMLRRSVLEENSLRYDCSFERVEDYELWSRMLTVCKGHNIQEHLLRYRFHASQVTQAYRPEQIRILRRLHRTMLQRMSVVLTQDEEDVFLNICDGKRTLVQAEYNAFVSGGNKILSNCSDIRRQVRRIYRIVNIQVKSQSSVQGRLFSVSELPYMLIDRMKRKEKECIE
jgi:glycosyltransferase involved in cell wall biosynthesis